jgi:hypothetical protein
MKCSFPPVTHSVVEVARHWLVVFSVLGCAAPPVDGVELGLAQSRPEALEAQFRGCQLQGWCRFWIEVPVPGMEALLHVRPDGVSPIPGDDKVSLAVRDRLNALLAGMIHQHKRIVLQDLRPLEDGTYVAVVTVNGMDVASDPVLTDLLEARTDASR